MGHKLSSGIWGRLIPLAGFFCVMFLAVNELMIIFVD